MLLCDCPMVQLLWDFKKEINEPLRILKFRNVEIVLCICIMHYETLHLSNLANGYHEVEYGIRMVLVLLSLCFYYLLMSAMCAREGNDVCVSSWRVMAALFAREGNNGCVSLHSVSQ